MGGIMCATLHTTVLLDKDIPCLKIMSLPMLLDLLDPLTYNTVKRCNRKKQACHFTVTDLWGVVPLDGDILPLVPDFMWVYGKWSNTPDVLRWNSFME